MLQRRRSPDPDSPSPRLHSKVCYQAPEDILGGPEGPVSGREVVSMSDRWIKTVLFVMVVVVLSL